MTEPPPQPPLAYQAPQPRRTNKLAVASLVCGIACFPPGFGFSFAFAFSGVFGLVFALAAVPAIFLGHIARRQIERSGEAEDGRGLATVGIVLGWLGLAFAILGIILMIVVWSSFGGGFID